MYAITEFTWVVILGMLLAVSAVIRGRQAKSMART